MIVSDEQQATIRLSVFIGVFTLMAVLEVLAPKKERVLPRGKRWLTNWSLVVINSVSMRFLIPVLAVSVAQQIDQSGWGLFNLVVFPFWLECILAIVVLDMLIYWQHVASHHLPILWRVHKVHHADRDIDVTTGARFHPIEIGLSMLYKFACIAILGAPALAVFIFEVLLNASAMFNHSNMRLAKGFDALMRKFIVTPDMHRVHHSIIVPETNSNYGFFLSAWDRLFSSYTDQPQKGHADMIIGLEEHQDEQPASVLWSLKAPFIKPLNKQ